MEIGSRTFVRTNEISGLSEPELTNHHCSTKWHNRAVIIQCRSVLYGAGCQSGGGEPRVRSSNLLQPTSFSETEYQYLMLQVRDMTARLLLVNMLRRRKIIKTTPPNGTNIIVHMQQNPFYVILTRFSTRMITDGCFDVNTTTEQEMLTLRSTSKTLSFQYNWLLVTILH